MLRADPTDLNVIAWLLERQATAPSQVIAAVFQEPAVLAASLQALEKAVHENPVDHRLWRQLVLFELMNRGAEQQQQFADRAAALERTARERSQGDRPRPVGRDVSLRRPCERTDSRDLGHARWPRRGREDRCGATTSWAI